MKRREFLQKTFCGLGAAWVGARSLGSDAWARDVLALPPLAKKYAASDTVTLGRTGIHTSRLAMGTGTVGYASLASVRPRPSGVLETALERLRSRTALFRCR